MCEGVYVMSKASSIRLTSKTKKRFNTQDARAFIEAEEWQLREIQLGIEQLDSGRQVSHEKVSAWLHSWEKPGETKAPQ